MTDGTRGAIQPSPSPPGVAGGVPLVAPWRLVDAAPGPRPGQRSRWERRASGWTMVRESGWAGVPSNYSRLVESDCVDREIPVLGPYSEPVGCGLPPSAWARADATPRVWGSAVVD